jgi:MFS family permease
MSRQRHISRVWSATEAARLEQPRRDLLDETEVSRGVFQQARGPFRNYERRLEPDGDQWRELIDYRFTLPWFGWLLALPVRAVLSRSGSRHHWWMPPAVLDQRQVLILGLLAAASMSSAFINVVFTQTVAFAAADFGIGSGGIGIAGSIVRAGIVVALPAAVFADRIGRRRVITFAAWVAPIATALGALAPNFWVLVATQTIGRPLGLALGFLVAVVAAEEMPRQCRAYAISVLAMASGLGAGMAVIALPLADLGAAGWRLVFVVSLVWLAIAADLTRRLPETERFERSKAVAKPHSLRQPVIRQRLVLLASVAVLTSILVAPASFFQNAYLRETRDYSALLISIFTIATVTPAGIGLIIGGRFADLRGRRRLIASALPISTVFIVIAFSIGGPPMWVTAFVGGFAASVAYPALAVYRQELFPTAERGTVAGLLSAAALGGGIIGLLTAGWLLDSSWAYGQVMAVLGIAQLI